MRYETLAYSISSHQYKYIMAMENIFNIRKKLLPETRNDFIDNKFETSISNGYYHSMGNKFNVMERIRKYSKDEKVISFCHSTFGSNENIYNCVTAEKGKYFAVPSAWKNILGYPCISKNSFEYGGHFMSLYHYSQKPIFEQSETVLYMPISGIKSIDEVMETLKNLMHMQIMIKVHPVIEAGNYSHKWNINDVGIPFNEYLQLARENSNISIVYESDDSLIDAIDKCRYIIGVPPTSTLIEAAIRGKIYGYEKLIIATNGGVRINDDISNCVEKYDIGITQSPREKDFAPIPENVINEFVIGRVAQESEIRNVVKKIKMEE